MELSRDVAQDVFIAAWTGLGKLRAPASFLPWLRQITRNRARHMRRAEARRRGRIVPDETDALVDGAADPGPSALTDVISGEEREMLQQALDGIPDDSREILILYY